MFHFGFMCKEIIPVENLHFSVSIFLLYPNFVFFSFLPQSLAELPLPSCSVLTLRSLPARVGVKILYLLSHCILFKLGLTFSIHERERSLIKPGHPLCCQGCLFPCPPHLQIPRVSPFIIKWLSSSMFV